MMRVAPCHWRDDPARRGRAVRYDALKRRPMDEATYRKWWPLHLRAVSGEALSVEERAAYEMGLRELHAEEEIAGDLATLRATRAAVAAAEAEAARLHALQLELAAKIRVLEAALPEQTRHALGVTD